MLNDIELKIAEIKSNLKQVNNQLSQLKWEDDNPTKKDSLLRLQRYYTKDLEILIKAHSIITLERRKKYWRDNILLRDNFTCLRCDAHSDLTIHHLIPKSKCDPSMYYAEYNGVILCMKCHREWHDTHNASDNLREFLQWVENI